MARPLMRSSNELEDINRDSSATSLNMYPNKGTFHFALMIDVNENISWKRVVLQIEARVIIQKNFLEHCLMR